MAISDRFGDAADQAKEKLADKDERDRRIDQAGDAIDAKSDGKIDRAQNGARQGGERAQNAARQGGERPQNGARKGGERGQNRNNNRNNNR